MRLTEKKAFKIIKNNDAINTGIFISILAHYYIMKYEIDEEKFLKSLKNSLKKLKK